MSAEISPIQSSEGGAWREIDGTWKLLHGSYPLLGWSIEWHDFRLHQDMDWGRSFHPGSLEICLNFSGRGVLQDGDAQREFGQEQAIIYTLQDAGLHATRKSDSMHRFLTIELAPEFLKTHFSDELGMLKAPIARFIKLGEKAPPFLEIKPLPAGFLPARLQFLEPPVPAAGRRAWYLGRVLEILAQLLFPEEAPDELFCKKHHRTNRDKVERVCYLIERDLENPPSLDMLATEVDCSPFHLSRIFARESGASIPKFLRMKRIEKAAAIIKTGAMNVTEAATAVGYSSLGSFTKAFVEQMGCCPGLYPIGKLSRAKIPRRRGM